MAGELSSHSRSRTSGILAPWCSRMGWQRPLEASSRRGERSSGGYLPVHGHAVDVPGSLIVVAAAPRAGCRMRGRLGGLEADQSESGFLSVAEQPLATHE